MFPVLGSPTNVDNQFMVLVKEKYYTDIVMGWWGFYRNTGD